MEAADSAQSWKGDLLPIRTPTARAAERAWRDTDAEQAGYLLRKVTLSEPSHGKYSETSITGRERIGAASQELLTRVRSVSVSRREIDGAVTTWSVTLSGNSTPAPRAIRWRRHLVTVGTGVVILLMSAAAWRIVPSEAPTLRGVEIFLPPPPPGDSIEGGKADVRPAAIPVAERQKRLTEEHQIPPGRPARFSAAGPLAAVQKEVEISGEEAASARAFMTGKIETWEEGQRRGYALAGEPREIDGTLCREVTVWLQDGAQADAVTSLRCPGGASTGLGNIR